MDMSGLIQLGIVELPATTMTMGDLQVTENMMKDEAEARVSKCTNCIRVCVYMT